MTLSHRFAHPVGAVWVMLRDTESHVAKFTGMGHRDLEVVSSAATDTTHDVTIRRQVDIDVPSVARKLISPSNTVTSVDHWERVSDDRLAGHYEVDIKGVPAETRGTTSVVADGPDASTYEIVLEVKVKVPLIGEKVAGALKPQLTEQITAEFAAADTWLASH
jgi:hypothetical protein